ncbi:MAG: ubiquinol-cytochrome c reductase iron-sulfur subunit [Bacteroidetes bacterium]|nr:ubiquinol-cytochrome c reductase iron-sulfur subunit [Bacteroidota bacterium]MBU1680460.1 ubiquinol-cytochrome c reductase iron-sulfur subunit [Bacteroidota bacterium]
MGINRRYFFKTLLNIGGLGAVGAVSYPVIEFMDPPKSGEPNVSSIKAGKTSEFEYGSARILKFGRKPVILIREKGGEFHALFATCTHLDCIVQYRNDTNQILCACHNGVFDLKGRNVSGPPPKPLTELAVNILNDEIIISTS